MPTTPLFHVSLPDADPDGDGSDHFAPLQIALEGMTKIDEHHIRRANKLTRLGRGVPFPPLYLSGVRCEADPPGEANWHDCYGVLRMGWGDPYRLAAWRAAELRVAGIAAEPALTWRWDDDGGLWEVHCLVRLASGAIEDPSVILGGAGDYEPWTADAVLWSINLPDADPDGDGSDHFAPLQIALEGMTKINEHHIRRANKLTRLGRGVPFPPLYLSGVRYREDPPGEENWHDCYGVLRMGVADCDRLAAYRAGELRTAGIAADPVLKWQWIPRDVMLATGYPAEKLPADGVWMVHCLVRFADGSSEDPSKILGMGGDYTSQI